MPVQQPYRTKAVLHDLMGKRQYDTGYLKGEVDEFLEAYKNKDMAGVDEELQDVMFGAQMLAHQMNKRDVPVLGADDKIREFYRRKNYYQKMFKDRDVPFNTDYLAGGSNPLKPHKIQGAFNLAGHKLPAQEAADYSAQYPSFKEASYGEGTMIKTSAQEAYYKFAQGMMQQQQPQESQGPSAGQIIGGTAAGAGLGYAGGALSSGVNAMKTRPRTFDRAVQHVGNLKGGGMGLRHGERALKALSGRAKRWGGRGALIGAGLLGGGALIHKAMS